MLKAFAINVRTPRLQQKNQQRIGVLADLPDQVPALIDRFQRPINGTTPRFLFHNFRANVLSLGPCQRKALIPITMTVQRRTMQTYRFGCILRRVPRFEEFEELGSFF
jgi:hypothetical protein